MSIKWAVIEQQMSSKGAANEQQMSIPRFASFIENKRAIYKLTSNDQGLLGLQNFSWYYQLFLSQNKSRLEIVVKKT